MSELIAITPERIGWLIWVVWGAIGVLAGIVSSRFVGPRTVFFCIIIGVVAAVFGGYLSTCFLGGGAVQLFLLSVLGAVFGAGIVLWIVAALTSHFRKDENLRGHQFETQLLINQVVEFFVIGILSTNCPPN